MLNAPHVICNLVLHSVKKPDIHLTASMFMSQHAKIDKLIRAKCCTEMQNRRM
jgi:hypothetical protein